MKDYHMRTWFNKERRQVFVDIYPGEKLGVPVGDGDAFQKVKNFIAMI